VRFVDVNTSASNLERSISVEFLSDFLDGSKAVMLETKGTLIPLIFSKASAGH
jgi:hypothetical protein